MFLFVRNVASGAGNKIFRNYRYSAVLTHYKDRLEVISVLLLHLRYGIGKSQKALMILLQVVNPNARLHPKQDHYRFNHAVLAPRSTLLIVDGTFVQCIADT